MSRFVLVPTLVVAVLAASVCVWVLRKQRGTAKPAPSASVIFAEWPEQRLVLGDLLSLPSAGQGERLTRNSNDRQFIAFFTVRPETCNDVFNEVVEFADVLGEADGPAVDSVLLVASDDADGVRWFAQTREVALPVLYEPSSGQLEDLRQFRGHQVYDQMIVVEAVSDRVGSVVLRVPLSTAVTPLQAKRDLVSRIGEKR